MLAKELVKGDRVRMGWEFANDIYEIVSGQGNIRTVKWDSPYGKEYGSIYIWDIVYVYNSENDKLPDRIIVLTPKQKKDKELVQGIMARF